MGDNRADRDEQADHAEQRQRERELREALERADEAEPHKRLGDLNKALENHEYPASTHDLIGAYGDHTVETPRGAESIGDILSQSDVDTFGSPDEVRDHLLRQIHPR